MTSTTAEEPAAWQEYRARLLGFVRSRVGNEADAEDIVQDVLVRAFEHRDTLSDHRKLVPWLYQITRNAIADYYRGRRPEEQLPAELPSPDRAAATGDGDASSALARCLIPFIEGLPAPYRDAVAYAELEGLTQRETAARLGISHSGAKSRVQRARAMLVKELLACCHVAFDHRGSIIDYERRRDCGAC